MSAVSVTHRDSLLWLVLFPADSYLSTVVQRPAFVSCGASRVELHLIWSVSPDGGFAPWLVLRLRVSSRTSRVSRPRIRSRGPSPAPWLNPPSACFQSYLPRRAPCVWHSQSRFYAATPSTPCFVGPSFRSSPRLVTPRQRRRRDWLTCHHFVSSSAPLELSGRLFFPLDWVSDEGVPGRNRPDRRFSRSR